MELPIWAAPLWMEIMKKLRSNKANKPVKKAILIYCDGDTEKNYAISLKHDRYNKCQIKIEPRLESKGYKDVFKNIKKMIRSGEDEFYHGVLYVLDMDTIYMNGEERSFQSERDKLVNAINSCALHVIESRPCIEFWFILHYRSDDQLLTSYKEAEIILQKDIPGYNKKKKFTQSIYDKLKVNLEQAVRNSKEIEKRHESTYAGVEYSYTHMHRLIEILDDLSKQDPNC